MDLVGAKEIADMLGVSRARVHQIAAEDKTFPQPVAAISAGRIWRREHIERWAKKRR